MWYRCLCVAHNSSIGEYVRSCTSSALIGVVSNVYLDAECSWGISFDISLKILFYIQKSIRTYQHSQKMNDTYFFSSQLPVSWWPSNIVRKPAFEGSMLCSWLMSIILVNSDVICTLSMRLYHAILLDVLLICECTALISLLKSLLLGGNVLTWLLFSLQLCCWSIRSHVRKLQLVNKYV